jgi:hypothetical protein
MWCNLALFGAGTIRKQPFIKTALATFGCTLQQAGLVPLSPVLLEVASKALLIPQAGWSCFDSPNLLFWKI